MDDLNEQPRRNHLFAKEVCVISDENETIMTEVQKIKEMLKNFGQTSNVEEIATSKTDVTVIRMSTKCRYEDSNVLPSFHLFISIDHAFCNLKLLAYNCTLVEQKVFKTEKVSFQDVKKYVKRFLHQLSLCPGIPECETG